MTSVPDPPVSFSSSSAYIQCLDAKGAGWERPCILSPPTWPFRGSIHLLRAGDLAMECFRCCGHISWNLCLGQFSTKVGSLFFPSMWLWSRSLGMAINSGGGLHRHKGWSWEAAHTKTDRSWRHSLSPASHVVCLCILPKCPGYHNLELPKSCVYDCAPAIHWDQLSLLPPSLPELYLSNTVGRAIIWSWLRFTYEMQSWQAIWNLFWKKTQVKSSILPGELKHPQVKRHPSASEPAWRTPTQTLRLEHLHKWSQKVVWLICYGSRLLFPVRKTTLHVLWGKAGKAMSRRSIKNMTRSHSAGVSCNLLK